MQMFLLLLFGVKHILELPDALRVVPKCFLVICYDVSLMVSFALALV